MKGILFLVILSISMIFGSNWLNNQTFGPFLGGTRAYLQSVEGFDLAGGNPIYHGQERLYPSN